jgi:two-component system, OmpR family, heavy metal sensor histidine kinase CusS
MRSLRLRLALLSTAISGIVIIAFGFAGWQLTVRLLREAVDLRISVPLVRTIRDLRSRAEADRTFHRLDLEFQEEVEQGRRLLVVLGREGEEIYRKPDSPWFEEIDRSLLKPPHPPGEPPSRLRDMEQTTTDPVRELFGESPGDLPPPPPPDDLDGRDPPQVEFHTLSIERRHWRVGILKDRGHLMLMAVETSDLKREVNEVRRLFLVSLPICLLLIGFGGWFVAHRAMRPVELITETVSHITARGLDQRIPEQANHYRELSRLVEVLNDMMERLERSFHYATRFSSDVSHELKTPLTVMQATLTEALQESLPGSAEESRLLAVTYEAERLSTITRTLLLLSQADAGRLSIRREMFSLTDEISVMCEDAEILCEDGCLTLETDLTPDLRIASDAALLRHVWQNLLSNAVKYNEDEGYVRCRLFADQDDAVFQISNSGPGIPAGEETKVFDRFHRGDRSRSREIDGYGLGLNLAQEILRNLGGRLRLIHSNNKETLFEVRLPRERENG